MLDHKALNDLRANIHQAVDTLFNEVISRPQKQEAQTEMKLLIIQAKVEGSFEHPWPNHTVSHFNGGQWYIVEGPFGTVKMLLAKGNGEYVSGIRPTYYVFGRESGPENPRTTGDWAQFVRTDSGEYACRLRNPNAPSQWLKEGMPVPSRYASRKVARRDALFGNVKNGPTLWYVVQEGDVESMLTHAYYTVCKPKHR